VKESTEAFWRCFERTDDGDITTLKTEAELLLDELRPFVAEEALSKRKFNRTAAAFRAGIEDRGEELWRKEEAFWDRCEDADEDDEEPFEEALAAVEKPKKDGGRKEQKP
jgi:hypothetical protein